MQALIVLTALVANCCAMVCPPNYCDSIEKPVLSCPGTIFKGTGFCGCTDSCARLEGEECQEDRWSVPNNARCDLGLTCHKVNLEGLFSKHVCVNESTLDATQDGLKDTADHLFVSKRFIQCTENICDGVVNDVENCKGGVIKSGFCDCKQTCAKVLGEACSPDSVFQSSLPTSPLLGLPHPVNTEACDDGLVCHQAYGVDPHVCIKAEDADLFVSKRSACDTPCRKKSLQCTFSFVIYDDQWFAKCDLEGNFMAEQCSRKGECFCVDQTGAIDESTRVLGSADCN